MGNWSMTLQMIDSSIVYILTMSQKLKFDRYL